MSPEESRKEREARSVALERAYVHDVYDQISAHFSSARYRAWPRVKQFLTDLEPGSFVADIGCGNGKYLHINQQVFKVGVDRCFNLTNAARERDHEVMVSDNLALPFRDESFDAALSIAVIHHFATTERRVRALRELARILKIGGRLMISVWAMEQRHRKFESQDVLVPWHRPEQSSSDDKASSIERDLNSTTTDDDDLLHYHAHNHSDSDSCPSNRYGSRKNGRRRTRSRAIDPVGAASSSQSSSDLSSPNESCYSFVRRALQKLTSSRRGSSTSGRSWFMHGGSFSAFRSDSHSLSMEAGGASEPRPSFSEGQRPSVSNDGSLDSQENLDDVPIELRHLEPDDPALLDIPLTPAPPLPTTPAATIIIGDPDVKAKSKSLTDLVQASPRSPGSPLGPPGTLFGRKKSISREALDSKRISDVPSSVLRSKSSSSCLSLSSHDISSEGSVVTVAVKESDEKGGDEDVKADGVVDEPCMDSGDSPIVSRKRPTLKKQKASINESDASDVETPIVIEISKAPKTSETVNVPDATDDKDHLSIPKGLGIIKQSSLNDEFICIDRFLEKEKLKQSIQKQSSLNEDLIYGNKEEKQETLRESLFTAQFKRLQNIRESFQRLRTASLDRFEREKTDSSLKKGIVKLLQSWKSEILVTKDTKSPSCDGSMQEGDSESHHLEEGDPDHQLDDKKHNETRPRAQSIYQLGKSSDGSDALIDKARTCVMEKKFLGKEPSDRKSSREESSDSSKENSFQSDTSLDSEDSCVSVIFVPKPGQAGVNGTDKERNRSVSSESSEGSDKQHSPKSPRSPKSPKSPGPGGRYFTPTRYLGTKGGVKTGPKMGTQVLGGSTRPEQQRRISPPSDAPQEIPISVQSPMPTPEKTKSDSTIGREVPTIRTVAMATPRPPAGRGGSLGRLLNHNETTPPDTPPPTKSSCSGSYFSHSLVPKAVPLESPPLIGKSTSEVSPAPKKSTTSTVTTTSVKTPTSTQSIHQTSSQMSSQMSKYKPKYEPQVVKRDTSFTQQLSSLLLGENVEIIRKTGNSGSRNVQIVRKTVPRFLTFDVFNPETDDLDSDSSASSSPNSGSSVIERGWPTERDIEELDREIKRREEEERRRAVPSSGVASAERVMPPPAEMPKLSLVEDVHRMDTISEDAGEHSGTELNGAKTDKKKDCRISPLPLVVKLPSRSTSISRSFIEQSSLGVSRRELESMRQRSTSMASTGTTDVDKKFEAVSKVSTSSPSLLATSSSVVSSLDSSTDSVMKRSPKARRKLTIAHLDQPLPLQPSVDQKLESKKPSRSPDSLLERQRSPDSLLERQCLRSWVPDRHHQPKALSPLGSEAIGRGEMKPWAEVAIKPLTETVNLPPPTSWRGKFSPEGILKGISEFDKVSAQKKNQEAKKGELELPFTSPCRSSLSPSSSVSSTSPSLPRELGREDPLPRSPMLSSPTLSTSSGESRSGSHIAMSLFRESPFSFEMFRMNRSESSLPLLSPEESQPNHGTFKEPVKPIVIKESRHSSKVRLETDDMTKEARQGSHHIPCSTPTKEIEKSSKDEVSSKQRKSHGSSLKVRIEDTKQKENGIGKKNTCRLCARENDKRQKKKKQEQLTSVLGSKEQQLGITAKRRATNQGKTDGCRRGELRSQGSLDSAKEKESAASKSSPPLVRSGSLDLEKAERNRRESGLSRDASLSTSQDSLQSDMGGAPTLHRYYHVFREGELDQLIEKYVHNLHIISSYYDHANWCVIAEKVQVWTI
ncbi:uncharacterized protein fid isoform X2 [Panulirus ornatus]|uniref:uncharacterized protein fid isoform X2 n=1 Tax=Panulirus ornatus TaxID=150431 RepID=UPI003A852320